ncbi:nucleotidyl transferase AbiEii/AbiGii toxin family protein [Candidatus Pacearchaeota archaeon]|nr:nucleotidyl transferase AbiEii/AbiGii toxin family protein [Candidatus Pacearchaeota archaeon]
MKISNKYLEEVKEKYKGKKLDSEMIRKDLALSYILYEIAKHIEKNENSPFKKLIFKGGTLLAKSHLDYHRLSEDLDFTFKDIEIFEGKSKTNRKKRIRTFLKKDLLPEFKKICEKYEFDFDETEIDRFKETKYFHGKKSELFICFKIYIDSEEKNPIKIEINFCDNLFYKTENIKLKNLHAKSEYLSHILEDLEIISYNINEILCEKLRAILTRKKGGISERDIFDLYLLAKKGHDALKIKDEEIKKKIRQGIGYRNTQKEEIKFVKEISSRLEELEKLLEKNINRMNLTDYDSEDYRKFFSKLKDFLNKIDFSDL